MLYKINQSISSLFLAFFLILFLQNCRSLGGESWHIANGKLLTKDDVFDEKAKLYWDYIYSVLPNDLLSKYIVSLKLFSDGEEEDFGGMTSLNNTNTKWELDLDTVDFNLLSEDSSHIYNYNHTLIHEFAHLLTLNPEQVIFSKDKFQDNAKGYLTQEGYAKKESYLGVFVKEFWKDELLFEWDEIRRVHRKAKKIDLLYDFYLTYKNQFVSSYAAESPEEDIAESWVFFILGEKQKIDSIKHEKIMFFYRFPELVEYRLKIRSQLKFIPIDYLENYIVPLHH